MKIIIRYVFGIINLIVLLSIFKNPALSGFLNTAFTGSAIQRLSDIVQLLVFMLIYGSAFLNVCVAFIRKVRHEEKWIKLSWGSNLAISVLLFVICAFTVFEASMGDKITLTLLAPVGVFYVVNVIYLTLIGSNKADKETVKFEHTEDELK
jgi:hypothetical protein